MVKTYELEALASRVFLLVLVGIAAEIAVMAILSF